VKKALWQWNQFCGCQNSPDERALYAKPQIFALPGPTSGLAEAAHPISKQQQQTGFASFHLVCSFNEYKHIEMERKLIKNDLHNSNENDFD
jgi:hypothetical protein